jgi:hypothetical protein
MMRQNAAYEVTHMVKALTIFVTIALCGAAAAHPLEDVAYEAMTVCIRIDGIETLDQCMATTAPSPDRPAAKAALQKLFKERSNFIQQCDTGRNFGWCQEQADLYIWAGISRDFKWNVQHLDGPR